MSFDEEAIKRQIPYYLTAAPEQKVMLKELESLLNGASNGYFLTHPHEQLKNSMMQGDGWKGLYVYSFATERRIAVRGIILSNSCDLSPENDRVIQSKVAFVPIVKLSAVYARFQEKGIGKERIDAKVEAIRLQRVSNAFYLPQDSILDDDYVAFLDDIHSFHISNSNNDEKLFTLSMAGFYLFLFKLSVHFCRFQENIDRRNALTQ